MKINRLDIVSLPVSDQHAAKSFYKNKLGFDVVRDHPYEGDQRWIELAPEGDDTSITLVTWFEQMPPGSVQGLVVSSDDVEEARAELQSQGVEISDVQEAPWGRYATFSDPDGNGWVIQEASEGR